LLSVGVGAFVTQNFPEIRNHPDDQNENIDRQAAMIDIGAWIAKGPENSGRMRGARAVAADRAGIQHGGPVRRSLSRRGVLQLG
jgi:hypothetical protein